MTPVVVDGRTHAVLDELSPRERQILHLMARGRSNRSISDELWLSHRTVESHIRHIFINLGLVDAESEHPRVAAVLAYLRAVGPG